MRPIMDYRKLNDHCSCRCVFSKIERLAKGRVRRVSIGPKKAYLQVHVHRSLWASQIVLIKEQRYCLTRMGFGLNVTPSIMRSIVKAVLSRYETIQLAISTYIGGCVCQHQRGTCGANEAAVPPQGQTDYRQDGVLHSGSNVLVQRGSQR